MNAMKKLLLSLAAALVLACLGYFGWKAFGPEKVRERITTREGANVISEALSYYLRGQKAFGKVYKPCDEDGRSVESEGTRPVVLFFHEPLKTAFAAKTAQALAGRGVFACTFSCDGNERTVRNLAAKVAGERFADPDLIFLAADGFSGGAVAAAALKRKDRAAGLMLFAPSLDEKTLRQLPRLPYETLSVGADGKMDEVFAYLEEHGAMK